jgi:hypothetical protein
MVEDSPDTSTAEKFEGFIGTAPGRIFRRAPGDQQNLEQSQTAVLTA